MQGSESSSSSPSFQIPRPPDLDEYLWLLLMKIQTHRRCEIFLKENSLRKLMMIPTHIYKLFLSSTQTLFLLNLDQPQELLKHFAIAVWK